MAIKVNGEVRRIGNDYVYMDKFKDYPEFGISSPVTVAYAWGSTVTVESLFVTGM